MAIDLDEIERAIGVVDVGIIVKENRDGYYAGSQTLLFLPGKGEIFGPRQHGYPLVSKDSMEFYASLFSKSPEWLRLLVDRVRTLEEENERLRRCLKLYSPDLENHVKGPTHTEATWPVKKS